MYHNSEEAQLVKLYNHYLDLANCGKAFAQSYIAEAHFWGWGCQKDYAKFVEWDTIATKNGSLVSGRRMFLYYYSKGNLEAASTLYTKKNTSDIIPCSGLSTITSTNEFVECFGRSKDIQHFFNAYENAIDTSEPYRNDSKNWRKDASKLLRAISYIYGFGVEQNYNVAKDCLLDIIDSNDIYECQKEIIHYLLNLYEVGCSIDSMKLKQIIDNLYLRWMVLDEPTAGCFIKHAMRLATLGNTDAAHGLGIFISTKSMNKERGYLFWHDDRDAMYWFSSIAEKPGNANMTMDAIQNSSNINSDTFNYEYAKHLCYYALNNTIFQKDNAEMNYDYLAKACAASALINLAIYEKDEVIKKQLGNDALCTFMELSNSDYDNPKEIGRVYCDVFSDYDKALYWFEKAENSGWDVESYIRKCKKNAGFGKNLSHKFAGLASKLKK